MMPHFIFIFVKNVIRKFRVYTTMIIAKPRYFVKGARAYLLLTLQIRSDIVNARHCRAFRFPYYSDLPCFYFPIFENNFRIWKEKDSKTL